MPSISVIGIDLSKRVFQLHGLDSRGKTVFQKKLTRPKFIEFRANLPTCTVAMEACGSAHFFARKFQSVGHEVIPPGQKSLEQQVQKLLSSSEENGEVSELGKRLIQSLYSELL